jgi:hypothetical protein
MVWYDRLAGVLDLSHEVQKADEYAASFGGSDDRERERERDRDIEPNSTRKRSSSAARQVKQYFGISNGTSGLVSRVSE